MRFLSQLHIISVSTHDLTKRSTEAKREKILNVIAVSTHDLTKRSTGVLLCYFLGHFRFNSRPHEEVDAGMTGWQTFAICFNSRPHEEVDMRSSFPSSHVMVVSTHDLTKRSTNKMLC